MVASILVLSMIINRKRGYRIFERRRRPVGLLEEDPDSARSSDDLLSRDLLDPEVEDEESSLESTMKDPPKKRRCCCATIYTPNTSRFADHYHSRILQKFPFLIEMFYWIITYAFYRCTKVLTQAIFSEHGVWEVAQDHGLAILDFEQYGWLSFLWPIRELQVQQWFMHGHQTMLTILNRSYALIHIPGTVGYVSHGQIALKSIANLLQFHWLVVLRCSFPCNICTRPKNHDPHQSPCFLHFRLLSMHASPTPSPRVWIPRHCWPR
jgi:hypothetical protein